MSLLIAFLGIIGGSMIMFGALQKIIYCFIIGFIIILITGVLAAVDMENET